MAREATWLDGVSGHLALDLVNTVSWRHDPPRFLDRLDGPAALAAWTAARSLPVVADATPAELAALRALREAIHAVVIARAVGEPGDRGAAGPADDPLEPFGIDATRLADARRTLRDAAAAAVSRATLDFPAGARWTVPVTGAPSLHDHLALAAVDLLATADPARLHSCAAHDCGWVFLDTSRSGTRRWCDSAGCGNRARARRHHARHHRSAA